MSNSMIMEPIAVFKACKAFYNLSTTEVIIIDYLYNHGTFVGDATDLSKRLKIGYTQITPALTHLDEIGVVLRNTTGDKHVRMRALALFPHWEYNLIRYDTHSNPDNIIKHKKQAPSICV